MSADESVHRRWQTLDEEQRAVADEIVRRALVLHEAADGELSLREAVELAADAVQRRTQSEKTTADLQSFPPPAEVVTDGR